MQNKGGNEQITPHTAQSTSKEFEDILRTVTDECIQERNTRKHWGKRQGSGSFQKLYYRKKLTGLSQWGRKNLDGGDVILHKNSGYIGVSNLSYSDKNKEQ